MQKTTRYIKAHILKDLEKKMVFIGGPKQVGKTTLAKSFIKSNENYINYDNLIDRKNIINLNIFQKNGLLVIDEIHKYRHWRSLLKGIYDKNFPSINFLITGSARLDHFRKGGDSLLGRYHYYRLHPFTLPELSKKCEKDLCNLLLDFGGFPESLFSNSKRTLKRWNNERIYRVIDQDIRDLYNIKEISNIEILLESIPSKITSLLYVNSLSEDIQVSPHTINSYLDILDNMYLSFRIEPFLKNRLKAIKKAKKIYLWDYSCIENEGAKFEKMVASHLLKFCHFNEDYNGDKMELKYIRDLEGREVDFVVVKNKKPLFIVECKKSDYGISKNLKYYKPILNNIKAYQVHLGEKHYGDATKNICVIPFNKFCLEENLV